MVCGRREREDGGKEDVWAERARWKEGQAAQEGREQWPNKWGHHRDGCEKRARRRRRRELEEEEERESWKRGRRRELEKGEEEFRPQRTALPSFCRLIRL